MPRDILKKIVEYNHNSKYNEILRFEDFGATFIKDVLSYIFNRDIKDNPSFVFRNKLVKPLDLTGDNGKNYEELYKHLTTIEIKKKKGKKKSEVNNGIIESNKKIREFDEFRSLRLHWIKFHIEENLKKEDILIFSYFEPKGIRTYIFDKIEKYTIVLEPKNNGYYFLITAYYCIYPEMINILEGKYEKRLGEVY